MNVDLSPDGRTIVFDVLWDIYAVPINGGPATQVTRGSAADERPVWSPDGRRIAYVSDAGGADNLWVAAPDGTNSRAVATERRPAPYASVANEGRTFSEVEWAPDGHSLLSGDTLFDLAGGTRPLPAIPPRGSPRFSLDGRYIYFSHEGVRRYERATRETIQLASPAPPFRNLVVSPNGRWLTYMAGYSDGEHGLRVRDVETGEDRWLGYGVGAWRQRYVFTTDSRAVIIGYGGKLHKIDVRTGEDVVIPFTARVNVEVGRFVYSQFRVKNDSLAVRYMRTPSVSPDGKTMVFSALQRLYTMEVSGGVPRPLVSQPYAQLDPTYSPDGAWIAYVTWSERERGQVWRVRAAGGRPERLTTVPALYRRPAWSPDGMTLAVLNVGPGAAAEPAHAGILQVLPSIGGTPRSVVEGVSPETTPTFTADGERLLFAEAEEARPGPGSNSFPGWIAILVSVALDGRERRVVARVASPSASDAPPPPQIVPSPDGRYVAYTLGRDLYLASLPPSPQPALLESSVASGPVVRLAPGLDPRWDHNSKRLTWISGNEVYRIDPDPAIAAAGRAPVGDSDRGAQPRSAPPRHLPGSVLPIRLKAPRDVAHGTVALRGARLITMNSDAVLENGTIVISNDRIAAVGTDASVVVPPGATIVEVRGKTIVPGLVDMHAHFFWGRAADPSFSSVCWRLLTNLAYGVTTAREVSGTAQQFLTAELIETGDLLGPRVFGVGLRLSPVLYRLESLDDARAVVQHLKRMGAVVVKQYGQPTRRQRQWVIDAAAEAGLNVTGHEQIDMLLGGATGFEHWFPGEHGDITRLIAEAGAWYTPTHLLQKPVDHYYALYSDPKYRRFVPEAQLNRYRTAGQRRSGDADTAVAQRARPLAEIVHNGGHVTIGSHGDNPGVGVHWEIWALKMGGLSNHEALRAATLHGAEGLGMQQDLGSLEVGKIADLLVLDQNPLENIESTLAIRYVMRNGVLYDGNTLATLWPGNRARTRDCPSP